jgi:hypothetical protein
MKAWAAIIQPRGSGPVIGGVRNARTLNDLVPGLSRARRPGASGSAKAARRRAESPSASGGRRSWTSSPGWSLRTGYGAEPRPRGRRLFGLSLPSGI